MGCHSSSADSEQLQACASSVLRPQLRRLSRKQLRNRLAELGAAKTEAQGLFHGELVDVVLLWNCLWKLHLDERSAQEEAIRALKRSGLPAHLLRKALLVVGVEWKDCCNLNGKEAEALLNQRIVRLVMQKAAASLISGTTYSLLLACFKGWKVLKGSLQAIAEDETDTLVRGAVFESLQEESRKRDEVIVLMEEGKRDEAARRARERNAIWDKMKQQTREEEEQMYGDNGEDDEEEDPEYWRNDAQIEDQEEAAPTAAADLLRRAGGSATEASLKGEHKLTTDQDARDQKFDALDSELAQGLDDLAEASPPRMPQVKEAKPKSTTQTTHKKKRSGSSPSRV